MGQPSPTVENLTRSHTLPALNSTTAPTPTAPRYGPPDASLAPRYTGIKTFARCPHVSEPDGVDVAVVGVPFDTATSFRAGARFGPEAIRAGSPCCGPITRRSTSTSSRTQSVVDWGDIEITPGNAERTTEQIATALGAIVAAGVVPIMLGGDHSIVLGELRAHAAVHGPVGAGAARRARRHLGQYYGETYFHGTPSGAPWRRG